MLTKMIRQQPTSFQDFYHGLNAEQKRAVDTIEGPVMVLAGPGTGKTQVLAMRAANILQQTHMDPWNILCLTFTESGVVAMRERLLAIIGPTAYQLRIHTFHSFCNDIIQDHPEIFSLSRDWQVLAEVERIEMMREILDAMSGTSPIKPFGNPYLFLTDIAGNIKQLKQEDISGDDFTKVLDAIHDFIKGARESFTTFVTLTPKERSVGSCHEIYEVLRQRAQTSQLPESLVGVMSRMYGKFEEHVEAAAGKRDSGKACTAYKNEMKRWFEKLDRQLPKQREMQKVYVAYQKELKRRGRYDYEDMVIMVVNELKTNTALLAEYQEQFQYLLVDEYQDTNGAQNELVYLLGSFDMQPNIFVVGDDKQSIYRFQGASLNNMLSFYQTYKDHITVVALRENYRSQPLVLEAAQGVIAHNEESINKYIPDLADGLHAATSRTPEKIKAQAFPSEEAEDYAVAQDAARLIREGVAPRDIAVLFRYNRDGRELLRMMQQAQVPARLEAGENVLDDVSVNQWLNIFEYIVDTWRDDKLSSILQYEWWGIDSLDALKAIHFAGATRKKLFAVIANAALLKEAGVGNAKPFAAFLEHVANWKRASATIGLQELLYGMITQSGWLDYVLEKAKAPVTLVMLQRLTTLLNEAKRMNYANHSLTLREFLDHINLLREHHVPLNAEPWQVASNAVRLMTAHRAKGLEFEYVYMTRLNDKHWGNNREPNRLTLPHGFVRFDMIAAQENNEDERRLFYVALTRAKGHIMLTRATYSSTGRPQIPSLFLEEIPSSVVDATQSLPEAPEEQLQRLMDSMRPKPLATHDGIRHWLENLLRGYVLSVTALNNYLDCPRRFYIRNLLQVPTVRTPFQSLGTAVHNALRDFLEAYKSRGKLPPQEELQAWFLAHLQREILTEAEKKDTIDRGSALLAAYYIHYAASFSPHVLTEFNFDKHGVHLDGIPLTGQLDKIKLIDQTEIQKNGKWREGAAVNVVDYKTGNPERGAGKVKEGGDYFRQLVFYKLLCDRSAKFPYQMASGEIDFVEATKTGAYLKKKVLVTAENIKNLEEEIKRVWQEIHELKFLDDERACGECEYCV